MQRTGRYGLRTLLLIAALCGSISAQKPQPSPSTPDDGLRVTTELVQSDVMVLISRATLLMAYKQEQFELTVDAIEVNPRVLFKLD